MALQDRERLIEEALAKALGPDRATLASGLAAQVEERLRRESAAVEFHHLPEEGFVTVSGPAEIAAEVIALLRKSVPERTAMYPIPPEVTVAVHALPRAGALCVLTGPVSIATAQMISAALRNVQVVGLEAGATLQTLDDADLRRLGLRRV